MYGILYKVLKFINMNKSIVIYIINLGVIILLVLMLRKNDYYIYFLLLCIINNFRFLSFKKWVKRNLKIR